jgi:hypothetical protein
MSSYAHDAEVLVFNYKTRATESGPLAGFSLGGVGADPLATDTISLREAIVSIQVNKTKASPQGTFMITLKPTQEWTKILVPGSWCSIFMGDRQLKPEDLSPNATEDEDGNVLSPLKMLGLIMAVRVQKQVDQNGAQTLTYTISGYDFGYVFLSSIYINHVFQADVASGILKGPFSNLNFPKNKEVYGNPAINVQQVLQAWSTMSGQDSITLGGIKPPPIRMEIPEAVTEMFGTGKDVLQLITAAIGVDERDSKYITPGSNGESDGFDFKLVGEKFFMVWQLIVNNTLWGMINQYLNPLLNEAYCDLHPTKGGPIGGLNIGLGGGKLRPTLIVRQIPFSTPDFDKFWTSMQAEGVPGAKYKVTNFVNLPRTKLKQIKVIGYDVGYSDYDRVNFVEVNGFDIDLSVNTPGAFNNANKPRFEEGSIKRFGLRPKVFFGADYGGVRGNIDETGKWSPLMMDWWFNANRYANGTIECIGLIEHIAVGENIELTEEKILGHIESYTHTFTVDDVGNKIFRTTIDFSRGISSDSTQTEFKYVYGEANFGGSSLISSGIAGVAPTAQQGSIFEDDVQKRVTYTELRKKKGDSGPLGF